MTAMRRKAAPAEPIPMPTLAPVSRPLVVVVVDVVGLGDAEVWVPVLLGPVEEPVVVEAGVSNVLVVVAGLTVQVAC